MGSYVTTTEETDPWGDIKVPEYTTFTGEVDAASGKPLFMRGENASQIGEYFKYLSHVDRSQMS
jgi:hypothetical protein